MLSGMRVIDIARKANVSPETVRYYARLGLLEPSRDPHSTYKLFNDSDYTRLLFIRDARALGMPIADVKTIINASRNTRASHPEVMTLFCERLTAVREQICALKPVERRLTKVVTKWQKSPHCAPTGRGIAALIDTWTETSDR